MPQRLATPDDWCSLFREHASEKPEYLQVWLDVAATSLSIETWRGKASVGHVALAAHMFAVIAKNGERGPISSRAIDKIKTTYSAVGLATGLDANLSTTKYGRMFLMLRATLPIVGIAGRSNLLTPGT